MATSLEYLAGLFDGEGSFSIQVGKRGNPERPSFYVSPSMSVNLYYGTEVLDNFVAALGGKIYPYQRGGEKRGARWSLNSIVTLRSAALALMPHLHIKRAIGVRFLEALSYYPTDSRGVDLKNGERVWKNENILKVAEIALSLNPPRSRKSNLTLAYVEELRGLA